MNRKRCGGLGDVWTTCLSSAIYHKLAPGTRHRNKTLYMANILRIIIIVKTNLNQTSNVKNGAFGWNIKCPLKGIERWWYQYCYLSTKTARHLSYICLYSFLYVTRPSRLMNVTTYKKLWCIVCCYKCHVYFSLHFIHFSPGLGVCSWGAWSQEARVKRELGELVTRQMGEAWGRLKLSFLSNDELFVSCHK